jgi:O-antigen/teichoic acid export membrane protein
LEQRGNGESTGLVATSGLTRLRRSAGVLRSELIRGVAGTFFLNISALVLGFVLALVLSRQLGAAGYGTYAFAFAWASLLSVPAVLGLTPVLVRNVAAYKAQARWPELRGILRRANQAVLGMSLVLTGGAAAVGSLLGLSDKTLWWPFLIALTLVPLLALSTIRLSTLQALGHVVLARLPETVIAPALFLVFIGVASFALGSSFSASWAVGLQCVATLFAFAFGTLMLWRRLPAGLAGVARAYETRAWVRSATPLLLVSGLSAINLQAGLIILGVAKDSEAVGVYGAAGRIAVLTGFLSMTTAYPLMPAVARLHAIGEHETLRVLLPRSARIVLLLSCPIALAFLAFPAVFLGLFGDEFRAGDAALRILVLGELVKLVLGSASMALAMTGLEQQVLKGSGAGAAANVVLLGVLVPIFGVTGAAVAQAVSGLVANGVHAYLAWTRGGLYTPALRIPSRALRRLRS